MAVSKEASICIEYKKWSINEEHWRMTDDVCLCKRDAINKSDDIDDILGLQTNLKMTPFVTPLHVRFDFECQGERKKKKKRRQKRRL